MLTASETSVMNACVQALKNSDFDVNREDIDYSSVTYRNFTPTELHRPSESDKEKFEYYELTVYLENDVLTGYAIRNKTKTYGQPVTVEIHT